ncbi:MAG: hypothetical protein KBT04_05335 [Bacteroidales bacterium]|nr:hypothetical protein [Candidatus Colimorpha onthohippi]
MKKQLFFLVLVLMGAYVLNAQNVIDRQGRKQGHWVKTDKDGSKIYEGDFKDGVEVGTFTHYYPDGTVRIKNVFEPGTRRCYHEAYDEKGHLLATGYYDQMNRDGAWKYFAEDGRVVNTTTYKMGVKEGEQVVYGKAGDTAEVSHWANGRRHGRWWRRMGKQGYITARYVDGGLEGDLYEYDDNQRLVQHGQYQGGVKHGTYEHYEEGVLSVVESWSHGELGDRKVRILRPEEAFMSVRDMAYLMPVGDKKVLLITREGEKITTYEPSDNLYYRLGNEFFFMANKKNRALVANDCVKGVITDIDGSYYLDLDPKPEFRIFPDEDCLKAVRSVLREGLGELEK